MADPGKTIGRSIRTTGIYDLSVSEVLARLIDDGDTVVDAGANVGYMTMLAAIAAGPSGHVLSWEPHPELFGILERNIRNVGAATACAPIAARNAALGDMHGRVDLVIPGSIVENDGLSHLGQPTASDRTIPVSMETLDGFVEGRTVSVMKLDVEGAEVRVLSGARKALDAGRITHVVFEDHGGEDSEVIRLFVSKGYRVFSLGWSLRGLRLGEWAGARLAAQYEAPSYIASLAPDEVQLRCSSPGWITLGPALSWRQGQSGAHSDLRPTPCA